MLLSFLRAGIFRTQQGSTKIFFLDFTPCAAPKNETRDYQNNERAKTTTGKLGGGGLGTEGRELRDVVKFDSKIAEGEN